MTEPIQDTTLAQATILLSRYGFEMKGYLPEELIDKWLKEYTAKWIRAAIIEALYQGRYKAISVEQILKLWSRRKQMTCHFTHEFERLICRNLIYSVDSPREVTRDLPNEPKTSERKIQRKSFNPPVTYQQTPFLNLEEETHKEEENYGDQADDHHFKKIHQETDWYGIDENHNKFDYNADNLSEKSSQESHLANHDFTQVNQLTTDEEDEDLSSPETTVNNPQNLKVTLTNLDELFTHFFTHPDYQKRGESVCDADEDHACQWRGIMTRRAIDEFTPQLDRSELYSKLKAVVRQELEENSQLNR